MSRTPRLLAALATATLAAASLSACSSSPLEPQAAPAGTPNTTGFTVAWGAKGSSAPSGTSAVDGRNNSGYVIGWSAKDPAAGGRANTGFTVAWGVKGTSTPTDGSK